VKLDVQSSNCVRLLQHYYTEVQHDRALIEVLNRARELNIIFNEEKFQFK